ICGENNSGKTYVTYALYCLLKSWISLTRISLDTEMNELRQAGVVKINIRTKIVDDWPRIREKLLKKFLQEFPAMMSAHEELFSQTRLDFELEIGESWRKKQFKLNFRSEQGRLLAAITKPAESDIVEIAAPTHSDNESGPSYGLPEFIGETLINIVFGDVIPNVFIAGTERTGAAIFREDLTLAKSNAIELLAQLYKEDAKKRNAGKMLAALYPNYAKPVDDNVRFANTLPGPDSKSSPLIKAHPGLLADFYRSPARLLLRSDHEPITY
ncbi:MAG: hypothetical protein GY862_18450, partial [Gammaproteobacteria bacterium]|nr:hypothetical protein [Gammaproteobacteria bacterium]